jgi:hypothetical protein
VAAVRKTAAAMAAVDILIRKLLQFLQIQNADLAKKVQFRRVSRLILLRYW